MRGEYDAPRGFSSFSGVVMYLQFSATSVKTNMTLLSEVTNRRIITRNSLQFLSLLGQSFIFLGHFYSLKSLLISQNNRLLVVWLFYISAGVK